MSLKWVPRWFWLRTMKATPRRWRVGYVEWQINNQDRLTPLVKQRKILRPT